MTTPADDPSELDLIARALGARLIRWRWLLTAPAIVDMAGLGSSYLIRPTSPTSTATAANSVVVALDADVPWLWPSLFGVSLVFLVVALVARRWLTAAHVVAFTVLVFYTAALAVTAKLSHGGWAAATLAASSAAAQYLIAQVYARLVGVHSTSGEGRR